MSFKSSLIAGASALFFALPAAADGIQVNDPYARASSSLSQSGAAFMEVVNDTGIDDRLIDVWSDVAARTQLHTNIEDDNGVVRMEPIEGGIEIPAGETHMFARGGDHIMFMGLDHPFEQGDTIDVTLVFEVAGEVPVQIPVDMERSPMPASHAQDNGQGGQVSN